MDRRVLFVIFVLYNCEQVSLCKSGWSNWINAHKPSHDMLPWELSHTTLSHAERGGDYENSSSLPSDFCVKGMLTSIQCATAIAENDYATAQPHHSTGLSCAITTGFRCINRLMTAKICLDYKVKFYCKCFSMGGGGFFGRAPSHSNSGQGQTTRRHTFYASSHGRLGTSAPNSTASSDSSSGSNSGSNPRAPSSTIPTTSRTKATRSPVRGTSTHKPDTGSGSNPQKHYNQTGQSGAYKGCTDNGAVGIVGVSTYIMVLLLALIHTLRMRE